MAAATGRVCLPTMVLLVALGGCRIERLDRTDSADARADSSARRGADTGSAIVAGDSAQVRLDSVPRPPAATSATDTAPLAASPAELRELAAALAIPVEGVRARDLRDTFDERRGGGSRPHEALDIPAPRGTPVLSAADGKLLRLHSSVPGGLMVYAADPSDRFVLMYGHLDRYADGLVEGRPLRQGQLLGYVGTTGNAPIATPHLHFAVARGRPSVSWWRGTPVNPYPLLAGDSGATPGSR